MTLAIQHIPLPEREQSTVQIREPGIIRHVAIGGQEAKIARPDGSRDYRESVVLFAEIDPTAPLRLRSFVILQPGQTFDAVEGVRLVWCGVGISPNTGAIAYVYEVVRAESPVGESVEPVETAEPVEPTG